MLGGYSESPRGSVAPRHCIKPCVRWLLGYCGIAAPLPPRLYATFGHTPPDYSVLGTPKNVSIFSDERESASSTAAANSPYWADCFRYKFESPQTLACKCGNACCTVVHLANPTVNTVLRGRPRVFNASCSQTRNIFAREKVRHHALSGSKNLTRAPSVTYR